jgi:hypothetical protein
MFAITGSNTKLVRVQKFGISTLQTTAGSNAIFAIKRSTANTGGTSASPAMVPANSGYPAATASVLQYTANPTLGAAIGKVWGGYINSPAPATAGIGKQGFELDFSNIPTNFYGKALELRAGEVLAWNFNGAALPAGLIVLAYVVWDEV